MPATTSDDTAPEGYTTVHGYYRFTDIFYEWYASDPLKSWSFVFERTERTVWVNIRSRALPECDLQEVRSLKAFIAYDSIASPDHPLSVGKGGAELYLGTTLPPSFMRHAVNRISRYSSQWREEADVQHRSDRVHPVLVTRDETHERAHRAPFRRISYSSERTPTCLFGRLQERSRVQESPEGMC